MENFLKSKRPTGFLYLSVGEWVPRVHAVAVVVHTPVIA